jgi:hypothetical protein
LSGTQPRDIPHLPHAPGSVSTLKFLSFLIRRILS